MVKDDDEILEYEHPTLSTKDTSLSTGIKCQGPSPPFDHDRDDLVEEDPKPEKTGEKFQKVTLLPYETREAVRGDTDDQPRKDHNQYSLVAHQKHHLSAYDGIAAGAQQGAGNAAPCEKPGNSTSARMPSSKKTDLARKHSNASEGVCAAIDKASSQTAVPTLSQSDAPVAPTSRPTDTVQCYASPVSQAANSRPRRPECPIREQPGDTPVVVMKRSPMARPILGRWDSLLATVHSMITGMPAASTRPSFYPSLKSDSSHSLSSPVGNIAVAHHPRAAARVVAKVLLSVVDALEGMVVRVRDPFFPSRPAPKPLLRLGRDGTQERNLEASSRTGFEHRRLKQGPHIILARFDAIVRTLGGGVQALMRMCAPRRADFLLGTREAQSVSSPPTATHSVYHVTTDHSNQKTASTREGSTTQEHKDVEPVLPRGGQESLPSSQYASACEVNACEYEEDISMS